MSWVKVNDNLRVETDGIMAVVQHINGCEVRYLGKPPRVLKDISAEEVLAKVTKAKNQNSAPDSP